MSVALQQLIQILTLKPLSHTCFQGQNIDLGLPQIFGGQLLAQALSAAMQRVEQKRYLHACHAHFLLAGDVSLPIQYETQILREGKSFTVVVVNAYQQDTLIFQLTASFQVLEQGFEHQGLKIELPDIDSFYSEAELWESLSASLPSTMHKTFSQEHAFEVKIKHYNPPFNGIALEPKQQIWVKLSDISPLSLRLQQCLLAYFSDFHCIPTMLHPHKCGIFQQKAHFATLSHSIYFHQPVDFNQWLFFDIKSDVACYARGLASGQVFDKNGKLIASYQQEGLIRPVEWNN